MTAAIRYKQVTNTTEAPLTSAGVPAGDGSDKLYRVIQRILSEDDIGEDPGQTKNASGCIVDVLPPGTNVLALEGCSYEVDEDGESSLLDNRTYDDGSLIANIAYKIDQYNNIVVIDYANYVTDIVNLQAGYHVIVKLTIGPS